jgi:hypothetical protein
MDMPHTPDVNVDPAAFAIMTPQIRRARQMIPEWYLSLNKPSTAAIIRAGMDSGA